MIDNQIKDFTCQTTCGTTYGTAFLVSDSILLTARHCVVEAIDAGTAIFVTFLRTSGQLVLTAKILAVNEQLDICLLSVSEQADIPVLNLSTDLPRAGSSWQSYGFPLDRGSVGYRASGEIVQVLEVPALKMDLDLSVSASIQLDSYAGLSGAPVVADGVCVGVLRIRLGGGVGAISTKALAAFLTENSVPMAASESPPATERDSGAIAARTQFQTEFEDLVSESAGQFVFLEGAHGIGKTTFCKRFRARSDKFLVLGTYSFGGYSGTGPAPVVLAQPEYFFDWLSTSISSVVSGRPARIEEKRYALLVEETGRLLTAFSDHCKKHGKQGVIFLDGLNEGHLADPGALTKLIGLLPRTLPADVTVIFSAPNSIQLRGTLSGYLRTEKIVQLPKLTEGECRSFCVKMLKDEYRTPKLVSKICQKANGHPLYLRYLIEFANESDDQELSEFPELQGTIEEYYESLWGTLLSDSDAVNLLGLVSRLRWGIPIAELVNALTLSEHTVYIPTMTRIRHLLAGPDSTEIYHASFSEFIRTKTSALDRAVHEKIGRYCSQNMGTQYCTSNVVFHLLRSEEKQRSEAVSLCSQEWIDACVEIGVNPDTLMLDLKDCLSAAIKLTDAPSVFRLLLLQQRVEFRYNTLFAKNAFLVAEAMTALKRPRDAIRHAIRFDRPIISLEEGLHLSYLLIEGEHQDEVFDLLGALSQVLHEYRFAHTEGVTLDEFVMQTRLELLMLIHANWSDGVHRGRQFAAILRHAADQIEAAIGDDAKVAEFYISTIRSIPVGAYLYHADVYTSVDALRSIDPDLVPPGQHITLLALALIDYREYVENFGMRERKAQLSNLFGDFSKLLDEIEPDLKQHEETLRVLIELGAPSDLVLRVSERVPIDEGTQSPFVKGNGVDVDFSAVQRALSHWTIKGFLIKDADVPLATPFGTKDWGDCLARLIRTVAICEGKARRALADADDLLASEVLAIIRLRIINQLDFTLEERIKWESSYAIPEGVFAIIYQRVTIILRDCYPEELPPFLLGLKARMAMQLGLYSEGFREATAEVLRNSILTGTNAALNDSRYALMLALRDFVITGVENRHELVPELLKLIPNFAGVGAHEEAEQIYRHVLSVSMGPTWYKEDQFGLLTTALRHLPITDVEGLSLPQVGAFLERASGELTFQRFARYAKSELIGELCRRDLHDLARRYFQRQLCGSANELLQDMEQGVADRVSARLGSRHPGGALDEQQAILSIVNHSLSVGWRLRFALLQIFLCGDKRHIKEYAAAFANAIKRETNAVEQTTMRERLEFILATDVSESERSEFQAEIDAILDNTVRNEAKSEDVKVPAAVPETDGDVGETLFMPGLFGRQSAARSARTKLEVAEGHVKRKNFAAAREEAVATLREFQDGDWSIWGTLSTSASRAEEILHIGGAREADLIRSYGVLIENERHAGRWQVAEHLLRKTGPVLSSASAASVWDHTLHHIGILAGHSEKEARLFDFLASANLLNPDEALFELLLWTLDHPQWLRRERAAAVTLWLMETYEVFFSLAVKDAFSMTPGYRGDVIAAVLDVMSKRGPQEIWSRVSSTIDVSEAATTCKHVVRLSILSRIAMRAAGNDEKAKQVSKSIIVALRVGMVALDETVQSPYTPGWAQCIRRELHELSEVGALTAETLTRTEEVLGDLCAPQTIREMWELENAVSVSFREPLLRKLNRWERLVRHALACALFPYASQSNLEQIGAILRIYNPSAPERKMDPEFESFGQRILAAVDGSGDVSDLLGNRDHYFLNYCEFISAPTGDEPKLVEVFASFIPRVSEKEYAFSAAVQARFHVRDATELGKLGNVVGPTCLRPIPEQTLFGTFTPAVPSPSFMSSVGAVGADIVQKNWRHGRSFEVREVGKPVCEGCMLGIRKAAIKLPSGSSLVWTVMVDQEPVLVIDNNLKKLN